MVWGLKDDLENVVTIAVCPAGLAQVQVEAGASEGPFLLSPLGRSPGKQSEAGVQGGGEGTSAKRRPLPQEWERGDKGFL